MAGAPKNERCPTAGCNQQKDHDGNCTPLFETCLTPGCTYRKGHGGRCNADE